MMPSMQDEPATRPASPLAAGSDPSAHGAPPDQLAMYGRLAPWFHLLTAPEDYAEEAAYALETLRRRAASPIPTLLELGSGGGNLASHLRDELTLTLTDVSRDMLELSRTINPGVEHVVGDMRTLRLGRVFDAVLVHDAIMYLVDETDLRAALATVAVHLRPGGVALLMPDCVRETFQPSTDHGGHDGAERALRFVEWSWDPDPTDSTFVTEFAFLLRDADGSVRVEHDRHVEGLFGRATWLRLLGEAGLEAEIVLDPWDRDVFVALRR
jgi:SAM-dependent methyltransferase